MIPASLEQLIGPPEASPIPVDWGELRDTLGLRFPSDYREFVERYPPVQFYEFFAVYHPTSPHWNLLRAARSQLDEIRQWQESPCKFKGGYDPHTGTEIRGGGTVDYPVHPDPGGLFPWGINVNAQKCLWLTDENPEKWTVVIADRDLGWWHYNGPVIRFLDEILAGRFVCPVIGDHFPGEWIDEFEVTQSTD